MKSAPSLRRPRVALNFALTADGKITTRRRTPSDFTSPFDKHRMLEHRAGADAVLATALTVSTDGTSMGLPDRALREARAARGLPPSPLRIIVSNSGRLDPGAAVFRRSSPLIVFSTERMPRRLRKPLAARATLHFHDEPEVDLRRMLATLRADHRIRRLLCEGGGILARSLLFRGLVDDIHLTLCPFVFGGKDAPALTGPGAFFPESIPCRLVKMETVGAECFLKYRVLH